MGEKIAWTKINTGMGWNKYEGNSASFGPYIIEKEDDRCYSIWWGGVDIGEASSVSRGKSIAQSHCDSLKPTDAIRKGETT